MPAKTAAKLRALYCSVQSFGLDLVVPKHVVERVRAGFDGFEVHVHFLQETAQSQQRERTLERQSFGGPDGYRSQPDARNARPAHTLLHQRRPKEILEAATQPGLRTAPADPVSSAHGRNMSLPANSHRTAMRLAGEE